MFQKDMDHIDSSAVGGESNNQSTIKTTQEMAEKNTFFDKPIQKNEKSLTKGKLWKDQPTSKIYNANAIVENEVTGLNRLVKLEIVVEGTSIRFLSILSLCRAL